MGSGMKEKTQLYLIYILAALGVVGAMVEIVSDVKNDCYCVKWETDTWTEVETCVKKKCKN